MKKRRIEKERLAGRGLEEVEDCGPPEEEDSLPLEEQDCGTLAEDTGPLTGLLEVQAAIIDSEYIEDLTQLLPEELASDPSSSDSEVSDTEFDTPVDVSESEFNAPVDEKVFSDCPVTNCVSNLLILQYSSRHNLTQEAIADLLSLLKIHCPPNTVPTSFHSFQGQFPSLQLNHTVHYFCRCCLQQVPGKDVLTCPNNDCRKSLQEFRALSSFFEIPIEPQITNLLQRMLLAS